MATYLTADTHFHHKSVIGFSDRPFQSVGFMNRFLIESWNRRVNKLDTVYFLGDLSFASYEETAEILRQLNGKIIWIKGNHDKKSYLKRAVSEGLVMESKVADYIKYNKKQLWLTHIPLDIETGRNRMWNISGHVHNKQSASMKQINVGVDSPLYDLFPEKVFGEPFGIDEIDAVIEKRKMIIKGDE